MAEHDEPRHIPADKAEAGRVGIKTRKRLAVIMRECPCAARELEEEREALVLGANGAECIYTDTKTNLDLLQVFLYDAFIPLFCCRFRFMPFQGVK